MEQWAWLRSFVTPTPLPALPVVLGDGEGEVARIPAVRHPGTLAAVEGDLVLTTRRLLFSPLAVHGPAAGIAWSSSPSGATGGDEALVDAVAGRSPGLFHPPTLHLTGASGARTEFGVLSGRKTPNFAGANAQARDDFLAVLGIHLGRSEDRDR